MSDQHVPAFDEFDLAPGMPVLQVWCEADGCDWSFTGMPDDRESLEKMHAKHAEEAS